MEFDHLLRGLEGIVTKEPPRVAGLTLQQARSMQQLAKLPAFRNVTKTRGRGRRKCDDCVNKVRHQHVHILFIMYVCMAV